MVKSAVSTTDVVSVSIEVMSASIVLQRIAVGELSSKRKLLRMQQISLQLSCAGLWSVKNAWIRSLFFFEGPDSIGFLFYIEGPLDFV